MPSPTALSLRLLRSGGYLAEPVERFIAQAGIRRDLFGIIDVLACHERTEPQRLMIQCTSLPNVGSRLAKLRSRVATRTLLRAGFAIEVWGWFKRCGRWECKRVGVQADDLADVIIQAPARRRPRKPQAELFATV